ncbi:MAG: cytochrome c-type biogenesis protein [Ktedonobacterales bacterium]
MTTISTRSTRQDVQARPSTTGMLKALLRRPSFLAALALLLVGAVVWGVMMYQAGQPESLDQKTRDVASQLQCPICHGESVQDSPSQLAQQMRGVIRQKLAQGESEQQVITYFEQRYGDTILESPPQQGFTLLIWLPPVVIFVAGAYLVFTLGREWQQVQPAVAGAGAGRTSASHDDESDASDLANLSDVERRRLRALLRRELAEDEGFTDLADPSDGLGNQPESEDQWDR